MNCLIKYLGKLVEDSGFWDNANKVIFLVGEVAKIFPSNAKNHDTFSATNKELSLYYNFSTLWETNFTAKCISLHRSTLPLSSLIAKCESKLLKTCASN